jgi:NDP-sugar pyrophosphorylase family protein
MNGDIMTRIDFLSLLDFHERNRANATMCIREFSHTIPYGVVQLNGNHIENIVEKPVKKVFVSAGIYVLDKKILGLIPPDQFYDMPTLFQDAMDDGLITVGFPIHEYWLDIGHLDDFNKAQKEFEGTFSG